MARFRDVRNVSVFGTSWTGVQEVAAAFGSETFDYSADDNTDIRRVDVTKQFVDVSISVKDPGFKRDIKDPVFGTGSGNLALNEVMRITMSAAGEEIVDSAEDDVWLTYVGVTKIATEAEVELRDISQIVTASTIKIGDMDTVQFDVLPGAALTGLQDRTAYERFWIYRAVLHSINATPKHGDLAEGSLSFKGSGDDSNSAKIYNSLSAGGTTGFEKNPGDSGTLLFTAPAAVGGSGGDADITIANAVLIRAEIVATHGGTLERRYDFKAYSSDGQASPVSVA